MRRFLRPILRRPLPVFFVPTRCSLVVAKSDRRVCTPVAAPCGHTPTIPNNRPDVQHPEKIAGKIAGIILAATEENPAPSCWTIYRTAAPVCRTTIRHGRSRRSRSGLSRSRLGTCAPSRLPRGGCASRFPGGDDGRTTCGQRDHVARAAASAATRSTERRFVHHAQPTSRQHGHPQKSSSSRHPRVSFSRLERPGPIKVHVKTDKIAKIYRIARVAKRWVPRTGTAVIGYWLPFSGASPASPQRRRNSATMRTNWTTDPTCIFRVM